MDAADTYAYENALHEIELLNEWIDEIKLLSHNNSVVLTALNNVVERRHNIRADLEC